LQPAIQLLLDSIGRRQGDGWQHLCAHMSTWGKTLTSNGRLRCDIWDVTPLVELTIWRQNSVSIKCTGSDIDEFHL
jgi:hypothetical protein